MAATIPTLTFNNGRIVPVLGLGTWKSPTGEVQTAVEVAIDLGYRHIDGAHSYGNQKEVGAALKSKIDAGVVTREELFITSKLWNTFHHPDSVVPACKKTLSDLGLQYLDLYLMHSPDGYQEGGDLFPTVNGQMQYSDVDYLDTWKAMETLVTSGLVRSIGISNFNASQMKRIIENGTIKPVTNQVECHPYLNQSKLSKVCKELGVLLTAYSPLGSPNNPWVKPGDSKLLEDPKITSIAAKYKKTPAQIVIRYQIERGHIVIPKSVTKSRIAENMDVFGFELTADDLKLIDTFDCNGRIVLMSGDLEHKYYPWKNGEF